MAEDRAHLTGGEIQHPPAGRVVQERALGAGGHEGDKRAAIVQQVPASTSPESLFRANGHCPCPVDFKFIFMPFGATMSPGCMPAGHGPAHLASCVIVESLRPIIGGSECD